MLQVEELLDVSVAGFDIEEPEDGVPIYNLADVDFDKLKEGFQAGRKRAAIEQVRNSSPRGDRSLSIFDLLLTYRS